LLRRLGHDGHPSSSFDTEIHQAFLLIHGPPDSPRALNVSTQRKQVRYLLLVPKLCLGTPGRETLFRETAAFAKQSFAEVRSQTESV
jgi:hypothetical protein